MKSFTITLVPHLHPRQLEWRNDLRIRQWTRQSELLTIHEHERWLKSLDGNDQVKMFGVSVNWKNEVPIAGKFFRKEPEIVGCAGFSSIRHLHRTAEFSLFIAPEHQRQGYGKEALKELLRYGFRTMDLRVIYGETFDGNPAWMMFKEVGFKEEGLLRARYYKFGKIVDCHAFSMTREEFEEAKWATWSSS
jgi:RimJ/RimL family protein N-acetyltransferase